MLTCVSVVEDWVDPMAGLVVLSLVVLSFTCFVAFLFKLVPHCVPAWKL